ncbi:MAG: hypothetical protein F4Z54_06270 [Acidimicrobiaceae bacterium]|nr:hypothetical protein [Acidimicrobiaceae bacterium]
MDEDDAIAIATRRLISDHPFFRSSSDSEFDHGRIYMYPGKNVKPGSGCLTTLEVFYQLNIHLLLGRKRRNKGWGENHENLKVYQNFRPNDDEIDGLTGELTVCWDALVQVLPMLGENGISMRDHTPPERRPEDKETQDCVLFWPIAQVLLADLVRNLLDDEVHRLMLDDDVPLDVDQATRALAPLASLNWDAHSPPWKYILLVPVDETGDRWRIANEDRKGRTRLMERIVRWQAGVDPLTEEETRLLRSEWYSYLPATAGPETEAMWSEIVAGVIP